MAGSDTVLVIGGGVVGVSTAYCLAARGRQVVLVEKGEICSGASYGNAGLLLPSHAVPLAAPGVLGKGLRWMLDPESPFYIRPRLDPELASWLWRFTRCCTRAHVRRAIPVLRDLHRASLALYQEWVGREGIACGLEQRGLMILYTTPGALAAGRREAELLGEFGVEYQVLDGAGARAMEPGIADAVIGGVYYPEDAHVTPGAFVAGLAAAASARGVEIRTQTEVLSLDAVGDRVATVRTTRGDFRPAEVVLAGGAWSPALGRDLRLRLPIQPAKGYTVTLRRPATCPAVPFLLNEARVGATPMGDTLRLAGTLELSGLELGIHRRRVDAILRGARSYLRGLEEAEVIEIWRGLRPCTPDGLPILGRPAGWQNVTVAAGHCTIGQSLGPISGELAAQLVCGEVPAADIGPLAPGRF